MTMGGVPVLIITPGRPKSGRDSFMNLDTGTITQEQIEAANQRFDQQNPGALKDYSQIRPSWNEARLVIRKPLTDKKIHQYYSQGLYSQEVKDFRRQRANQKRNLRQGNFLKADDGRLIYSIL